MSLGGFRRGGVAALAFIAALALSPPAPAASVEGPCTAWFNGVEAGRIDSLSSPLLLQADQPLVFTGTDEQGTRHAEISLLLGPFTLGRTTASQPTAVGEFAASLEMPEVASNSVGLLRIRAATDHCTVEAWLRVTGRLPLTTSAGLAGLGLLVAGLAWLGATLVVNRRWSPWVAAACGLLTGPGAALLAQQFGRLQISYWSLAGCAALAAAVGLTIALLLRRRARPPAEPTSPAEDSPPAPAPVPQPAADPQPALASPTGPGRPEPTPPTPEIPYWSYVLSETRVLHLQDYTRVVATLRPGSWYLIIREMGEWAQVEAAPGVEGWVPRRSLHRQG